MLDTNVFVAAFWNRRSASAQIIRACLEGRVHLYYTHQIRREIFLILRNIKASERYRHEVESVLRLGNEIEAPGRLAVIADDPEDDKFLECAQISGAKYIVSNDEHLLRLGSFGITRIVKPSEFRRALEQTS